MIDLFTENMTSLFFDLLTERVVANAEEKLDRKRLSYKIRKQITRYENKTLPMPDEAEQIDFTNVNWYINAHLFDKITPCFNLPEQRQRDYARRSLLEAVYSEAGANTDAEKKNYKILS